MSDNLNINWYHKKYKKDQRTNNRGFKVNRHSYRNIRCKSTTC